MRDASKAILEERRGRLADLLKNEHEMYKNEILSMVETPDQVKERMK